MRTLSGSLQVDFEFFDLAEIDFHGIRALLNRYLDGEQWDLSGMSDALIAQARGCFALPAAPVSMVCRFC